MPKKITKVSPGMHGHLHLEFEDGSMQVIHRGAHEEHALQAGDYWPPQAPAAEPEPTPLQIEGDVQIEDDSHGEA